MNGRHSERSGPGRRIGLRRGIFGAWVLVAVACTGENIFPTGVVGGGELEGGGVQITEPSDGASVPVNDSVEVTASFLTSTGYNQLSFTHLFPNGTSQRIFSPGNVVTDTTLSRTLWTGTTPGDGTIIVEATDVLGNRDSDTISVTIE